MTPYWHDDWLTVYQGDCREVMASMEPESVHCVVTSPPYWGLRDYGIGGQLGLEPTPEAYVENMVAVFREVRRVLRDDGTVWLNLGDSYTSGGRKTRDPGQSKIHPALERWTAGRADNPPGLKDKDLVGIPWRVAFALQADGWYLRSDIIWAKPNPMPESVTDRPTKSHEYLFLLSKSPRYYFDAEAVAEVSIFGPETATQREAPKGSFGGKWAEPGDGSRNDGSFRAIRPTRNIRSVWTVATQPYPGAHFATFPEKLVEPCVKAGCPGKVCGECGAPWEREVSERPYPAELANAKKAHGGIGNNLGGQKHQDWLAANPKTTTGWQATCAHDGPTTSGVVLDPFGGSGTTGRVAQRLGRRAVLIDLHGEYLVQAMARNADIPLGLESA